MLSGSAVAFFGRFAAYENISLDEEEAYEEAAKKPKAKDKKIPLAGKFRGLPTDNELGL